MGVEEEIRKLLLDGKTPLELIKMGYKKPTVYKINKLLNEGTIRETYSLWLIENIVFNQNRYLPNQKGIVSFELRNTSDTDLYVYRIGIQPEWLKEEWIAVDSRSLLHPNEKKSFTVGFDIPNLSLGEYSIRFGIEGQYLYPSIRGVRGEQYIQWSEPIFIDVKMPSTGYKIFISHSTKDMFLVRQLEKYFECYGIEVIIAEDKRQPGVKLDEKFYGLIRESHFLLAILTKNGLSSDWVKNEVNYAHTIKKPIIPLVEESIKIKSSVEYINFNREESIESILSKIEDGINGIKRKQLIDPDIGKVLFPLVIGGLIGFFGGLLTGHKFLKNEI